MTNYRKMARRRMHQFTAISPNGLVVTVEAHLIHTDKEAFMLRNDRGMNVASFPKSWCIITDHRCIVDIQKSKEESIQRIRRNLVVDEAIE